MPLVTVPTIDPALPPAPDPEMEEAEFDSTAYAWSDGLPGFGGNVKAIGDATYANAQWAETKAIEAAASALAASNSEDAASDSAIAAAASESAAADLVGNYLAGPYSTDPTTKPGGGALVDGNWYINTVTGFIRAYTVAGGWVNGVTAVAGVSALNGQTGSLVTKTINNESILGAGNIETVGLAQIHAITQSF